MPIIKPDFSYPKESSQEKILIGIKKIISTIPHGAIFTEWLQAIIDKRRNEWHEIVGEGLTEIFSLLIDHEDKLKVIEAQFNPESFADIFLVASRVALATSEKEKLKALKNAVINFAFSEQPIDEFEAQIYLDTLGNMNAYEIKILEMVAAPEEWYNKYGHERNIPSMNQNLWVIVAQAFPELGNYRACLLWSWFSEQALNWP
jgi:hypothetical protein